MTSSIWTERSKKRNLSLSLLQIFFCQKGNCPYDVKTKLSLSGFFTDLFDLILLNIFKIVFRFRKVLALGFLDSARIWPTPVIWQTKSNSRNWKVRRGLLLLSTHTLFWSLELTEKICFVVAYEHVVALYFFTDFVIARVSLSFKSRL